jgi:hypothetical protein
LPASHRISYLSLHLYVFLGRLMKMLPHHLGRTLLATSSLLLSSLLLAVNAAPLIRKDATDGLSSSKSVILFDAPAFRDPSNPDNILAELQAFVSLRSINASSVIDAISGVLEDIGLDITDQIDRVTDRLALFAAVGLPSQSIGVNVAGCSGDQPVELGDTGFRDLGMVLKNVSIGACANLEEGTSELAASILMESDDDRKFEATLFTSAPDGFGVISDIDDTIKVSHVLDKLALAKATLFEEPAAVAGMPEVYSALQTSLNDPSFFYVSGSPYQLYPFLREFVGDNYPSGPLFLKNLTILDLPSFITGDEDDTINYKVNQIDKIHGMFPGKKFLLVGDSTEQVRNLSFT